MVALVNINIVDLVIAIQKLAFHVSLSAIFNSSLFVEVWAKREWQENKWKKKEEKRAP